MGNLTPAAFRCLRNFSIRVSSTKAHSDCLDILYLFGAIETIACGL
jgi:hypothetical protein